MFGMTGFGYASGISNYLYAKNLTCFFVRGVLESWDWETDYLEKQYGIAN